MDVNHSQLALAADCILTALRSIPREGEIKSCVFTLHFRDVRYDPDNNYYAGSGASADSYVPMTDFYERYIRLSHSELKKNEIELREIVATALRKEYTSSDYIGTDLPTIQDTMVEYGIYRAPHFDHICAVVAPGFSRVNDELIRELARRPDFLHQLNWRKFEELLASIFKNEGFEVELGPGRGDEGVDLRLLHKDTIGSMLTLVQAKRYSPERKITLEAVASLEGLLEVNRAHRGLFVTTSDFLPSARRFAEHRSYRLELAANREIREWLQRFCRPQSKAL